MLLLRRHRVRRVGQALENGPARRYWWRTAIVGQHAGMWQGRPQHYCKQTLLKRGPQRRRLQRRSKVDKRSRRSRRRYGNRLRHRRPRWRNNSPSNKRSRHKPNKLIKSNKLNKLNKHNKLIRRKRSRRSWPTCR